MWKVIFRAILFIVVSYQTRAVFAIPPDVNHPDPVASESAPSTTAEGADSNQGAVNEPEPFSLSAPPMTETPPVNVAPALLTTPAAPAMRSTRTPMIARTSAEFAGLPPAMIQLLKQSDQARKKGDYLAAASNVERALHIQPRSAVAYKRLAEIHLAQKRYREAEQWAKKALQYANFSSYTRTAVFQNAVAVLIRRAQLAQ